MSPENQALVDQAMEESMAAMAAERAAERAKEIAELERQQVLDRPDATQLERLVAEDRYQTADYACVLARTRAKHANAAYDQSFNIPTLEQERKQRAEEDQTLLAFADADQWLREWLLPTWRRQNVRWCAKWWLHAEAVDRVEAMWRAWEYLRGDGAAGPSAWWRDHGDYHLGMLTAQDGPFALCDDRKHTHQQMAERATIPRPAEVDPNAHIPAREAGEDDQADEPRFW